MWFWSSRETNPYKSVCWRLTCAKIAFRTLLSLLFYVEDSIPVSHPRICRLACRCWEFISRAFPCGGEHGVKTFLLGAIAGMIVVPLTVYCYFVSGLAPAATSAPAMPFETMLAHKALNARIAKEMPMSVPIQADDSNLAAGA